MLQQGGFPKPAKGDIPICDGIGLPACSRKGTTAILYIIMRRVTLTLSADFFDILHKQKRSWQVNDRPAYSDLAYTILGLAMESITGKTFDRMIKDSIAHPLGLSATGIEPPELSKAIIPPGMAGVFMGYDIANFN